MARDAQSLWTSSSSAIDVHQHSDFALPSTPSPNPLVVTRTSSASSILQSTSSAVESNAVQQQQPDPSQRAAVVASAPRGVSRRQSYPAPKQSNPQEQPQESPLQTAIPSTTTKTRPRWLPGVSRRQSHPAPTDAESPLQTSSKKNQTPKPNSNNNNGSSSNNAPSWRPRWLPRRKSKTDLIDVLLDDGTTQKESTSSAEPDPSTPRKQQQQQLQKVPSKRSRKSSSRRSLSGDNTGLADATNSSPSATTTTTCPKSPLLGRKKSKRYLGLADEKASTTTKSKNTKKSEEPEQPVKQSSFRLRRKGSGRKLTSESNTAKAGSLAAALEKQGRANSSSNIYGKNRRNSNNNKNHPDGEEERTVTSTSSFGAWSLRSAPTIVAASGSNNHNNHHKTETPTRKSKPPTTPVTRATIPLTPTSEESSMSSPTTKSHVFPQSILETTTATSRVTGQEQESFATRWETENPSPETETIPKPQPVNTNDQLDNEESTTCFLAHEDDDDLLGLQPLPLPSEAELTLSPTNSTRKLVASENNNSSSCTTTTINGRPPKAVKKTKSRSKKQRNGSISSGNKPRGSDDNESQCGTASIVSSSTLPSVEQPPKFFPVISKDENLDVATLATSNHSFPAQDFEADDEQEGMESHNTVVENSSGVRDVSSVQPNNKQESKTKKKKKKSKIQKTSSSSRMSSSSSGDTNWTPVRLDKPHYADGSPTGKPPRRNSTNQVNSINGKSSLEQKSQSKENREMGKTSSSHHKTPRLMRRNSVDTAGLASMRRKEKHGREPRSMLMMMKRRSSGDGGSTEESRNDCEDPQGLKQQRRNSTNGYTSAPFEPPKRPPRPKSPPSLLPTSLSSSYDKDQLGTDRESSYHSLVQRHDSGDQPSLPPLTRQSSLSRSSFTASMLMRRNSLRNIHGEDEDAPQPSFPPSTLKRRSSMGDVGTTREREALASTGLLSTREEVEFFLKLPRRQNSKERTRRSQQEHNSGESSETKWSAENQQDPSIPQPWSLSLHRMKRRNSTGDVPPRFINSTRSRSRSPKRGEKTETSSPPPRQYQGRPISPLRNSTPGERSNRQMVRRDGSLSPVRRRNSVGDTPASHMAKLAKEQYQRRRNSIGEHPSRQENRQTPVPPMRRNSFTRDSDEPANSGESALVDRHQDARRKTEESHKGKQYKIIDDELDARSNHSLKKRIPSRVEQMQQYRLSRSGGGGQMNREGKVTRSGPMNIQDFGIEAANDSYEQGVDLHESMELEQLMSPKRNLVASMLATMNQGVPTTPLFLKRGPSNGSDSPSVGKGVTPRMANLSTLTPPYRKSIECLQDSFTDWHIAVGQDSIAGSSLSASTVASAVTNDEQALKKQLRRKLMLAHKSIDPTQMSQGSSMLSFNQSLTSINEIHELSREQMELLELGSKVSFRKGSIVSVEGRRSREGSDHSFDGSVSTSMTDALSLGNQSFSRSDDYTPRLPERIDSDELSEMIQSLPSHSEERKQRFGRNSDEDASIESFSRSSSIRSRSGHRHRPRSMRTSRPRSVSSAGSSGHRTPNEMPEVAAESQNLFLQLDFQSLGSVQYANNMAVNTMTDHHEEENEDGDIHMQQSRRSTSDRQGTNLFRSRVTANNQDESEDDNSSKSIMDRLWQLGSSKNPAVE